MEINSEFDFKDFDSIKKYLIPNNYYVHVLALFILLFCIFTNKLVIGLIIGIIGVAIMELLLIWGSKRNTNIIQERFRQSLNGKEKLQIDLVFNESSFSSHSQNTDSSITLTYDEIKKLIIKDKYSLLVTNANTFLVIETNKLLENKLDEFLLSKNPRIKIK